MQGKQVQHFANFGIIKKQNKANKQIFDRTGRVRGYEYDKLHGINPLPPEHPNYQKLQDLVNDNKRTVRQYRNNAHIIEPASPVRGGGINPNYTVKNPDYKKDTKEGLNATYKRSLIKDYNRKLISNAATNTDPKRRKSNLAQIGDGVVPPMSLLDQSTADAIYKNKLIESRRNKNSSNQDPTLKPVFLKQKGNPLTFNPTKDQLEEIYTRDYAKDDRNNFKYTPKLLTGSANHTWLTADDRWGEIPIGQSETKLNAKMWSDKYGNRLPDTIIGGGSGAGSPKDKIQGRSLRKELPKDTSGKIKSRTIPKTALEHTLMRRNDVYQNETYNNRWVPNE